MYCGVFPAELAKVIQMVDAVEIDGRKMFLNSGKTDLASPAIPAYSKQSPCLLVR